MESFQTRIVMKTIWHPKPRFVFIRVRLVTPKLQSQYGPKDVSRVDLCPLAWTERSRARNLFAQCAIPGGDYSSYVWPACWNVKPCVQGVKTELKWSLYMPTTSCSCNFIMVFVAVFTFGLDVNIPIHSVHTKHIISYHIIHDSIIFWFTYTIIYTYIYIYIYTLYYSTFWNILSFWNWTIQDTETDVHRRQVERVIDSSRDLA